jgi:hypothetical protein
VGQLKKKLEDAALDDSEEITSTDVRKINALLRIYFHINPDELSDTEWAMRWKELVWCLKNNHPKTFNTNVNNVTR